MFLYANITGFTYHRLVLAVAQEGHYLARVALKWKWKWGIHITNICVTD